jgi:peptidoglycan/xylan/chitin deacetylase (PgdA/CDA1 family)
MADIENSSHRATVCISADFDAMSIWMSWGARGARVLSRGEFGATIGAPRLLQVLERYSIPSTWFVPGHTAESWPEVTAEIAARGHEIGAHGYLHEAFDRLSRDEVTRIVRKSNDALERVTGQRPRGLRVPAGDFDGELLELMVDEGFSYDSSLLGGDFFPYWCRGRDELDDDGPVKLGPRLNLVELPIGFITNDFNHFEFNYGNPTLVGHDPPRRVEEIWREQFDYMHEHCPGGTLILTLHPQTIGQGLRIAMLERFILHCMSRPGTRFATHESVATEFRQAEVAAARS